MARGDLAGMERSVEQGNTVASAAVLQHNSFGGTLTNAGGNTFAGAVVNTNGGHINVYRSPSAPRPAPAPNVGRQAVAGTFWHYMNTLKLGGQGFFG